MQSLSDVRVAENILARVASVSGAGRDSRIGVFCAGGAQTGAFGAGVLHQMHDMGLFDKFDYVIGGSASAPNIGFFLSGKGPAGISYYWEENCDGFINPWRFWKIVDLSRLEKSMRDGKPLDVQAVIANPTRFFVTLTDLDGKGRLFDAKSSPDIIIPIVASCGLPIFWNRPRAVVGEAYLDGAVALPLPVSSIARQFQLADLLVVINQPNVPESVERSAFEKIAARCLLRPFSRGLEQAYLNRKREYNAGLAEANSGLVDNGTTNGCRVALLAPSYRIPKHCTNPAVLKDFAEEGRKAALNFFSQAK